MYKFIGIVYLCMLSIIVFADPALLKSAVNAPYFDEIDVDSNNLISKIEAKNSKNTWLDNSFDFIDKNKDGVLSKPEYEKAKEEDSRG